MPELLPFELKFPAPEEGIEFCGVHIPKYGSLTPNEAIALGRIDPSPETPILEYYAAIGNILLRSRTKLRHYTVEELLDLPILQSALSELFLFAINESRGWQEPEEEPTEEEGKPEVGQTSIGDSPWLTQENNGLVNLDLEIAQS